MASQPATLPDTLETRLRNEEYKNWIKAIICLGQLKKGLETFVEQESIAIHIDILTRVKPCGQCSKANKAKSLCKVCAQCKIEIEKLENRYTLKKGKKKANPCWRNTDVKEWPSDHWSIAKCFMNEGQTNNNCVNDFDISGILNFIINCKRFQDQNIYGNIQNNAEKVRKIRNEVIHTGKENISDPDLRTYLGDMFDLLKDENPDGKLKGCNEAVAAIANINKTMNQGFVITLEDEFTVRIMTLAGRLEAAEKNVTDLKQNRDTKDQEFVRIDLEVTNLSHTLDQLRTNVDCIPAIRATLDTHTENIGNMSEKVEENFVLVISKLKECETKFYNLHDQLCELKSGLSHLETSTLRFDFEQNVMRKQSDDQYVQLKDHTTKILNLDTKIENHGTKIRDHSALLHDLESQIQKQNYQLNEHDEEIRKEGILARDHDSLIRDQCDQLKDHEDKIQAQSSILDNLKVQIQDRDDQLKEHEAKFSDHSMRLQSNDTQLLDKLKEYDEKIRAQETKLGDHEAQIQAQDSMFKMQDGSIQVTGTRIDDHEVRIKDHDIHLADVKVQLHQQMTTISDHDTRIMELESDKKVTYQEIERLRDDLLSRYKSFRTIPMSPLGDGDEAVPLDEFYTDVFIEGHRLEQTSQNSNIRQSKKVQNSTNEEVSMRSISKTSHAVENRDRYKKEQLVSFKQLFLGRRHERIILTGLSGCGKSTFCRKIVHTWCGVQSKRNGNIFSTQTEISTGAIADEDVLLQFDLIFYINSSGISKEETLSGILCSQCIHTTEDQLSRILGNQPDNILVIFDGIDEMGDQHPAFMGDLLERKLCPRITFILVMRPWRISALHLNPLSHYDLMLEIQGFSEDNALKFVKKVIDLNKNNNTQLETTDLSADDQKVFASFRNVPLLLLFLAHLWCRNRSLPKKWQELYNQILDYLVERCLRKTGIKYADTFSDRYNRAPLLVFRESYLPSACKLAHDCLFHEESGPSVVMQEEHVLLNLGANSQLKLSALLDCGIITKVNSFSPLEKKVSISFLHLSIQEYLASMYIVQNEDSFQKFLASWTTLNDICRHENLIIFICGLYARHGKVFNRICQVCNADYSVLQYRKGKNEDSEIDRAIKNLNAIYRSCLHEIDEQEDLEISDVLLPFILDESEHSKLKYEAVKSMTINSCCPHDHCLDLSNVTHLNSLVLIWINCVECSNNLCKNISVLHELENLRFAYSNLHDSVLVLKDMTNLTSLALERVTMNEECSRSLCSCIGACTHLESINMSLVNLHDSVLSLSGFTDLTALEMRHVTMSEKCSESLCRSVGTCTHLKSLEMSDIELHNGVLNLRGLVDLTVFTLRQVTMSEECCKCVCSSIKFCTQLEKLIISHMTFHQGVLDINSLTKLKFVKLENTVISEECGWSISASVSSFTHLETLHLLQLTLHSGVLNFRNQKGLKSFAMDNISISMECGISVCKSISACTDLDKLELSDIMLQDGVLDLSRVNALTSITLSSVTMSEECATSLCGTIGSCTYLQNLHLTSVALHSGILDLNNLTRLITLTLDDASISSDCSESLCRSINACSKLETISLEHITLHNSVIHFTGFSNLISVCLKNVTMSAKCSMSVCRSISDCATIRSLHLGYITLHDGILSLSSFTRLRYLHIWYVAMSKECTISVYNTIGACSFLSSLHMSITLDEGILHCPIDFQCLSNLTSLWYLKLRNVIISWESVGARCLCVDADNIFKEFEFLLLRSSDGKIDLKRLIKLSKLTHATHPESLTLSNITISSEYSESKCSCINVTLSYRGIKSQDGLLYMSDFKSLREFTSLTLENVILSAECSRSLCYSISDCIHLQELYLSHIMMHDSVLDLKLLKKLTSLMLKNVSMSTACSESLCKSISVCTLLEKLHLEHILLHDGRLTMDGLKNLKSLELQNVTMSQNCHILLCSSLSACRQLARLEIKDTKFIRIHEGDYNHDHTFDLKNFSLSCWNSLTTLALENISLSEEFGRSLFSSSDICKNLETLQLNNATLNCSHIDFSNLVTLKSLCLNVEMSKSNRPLSGSVGVHFPARSVDLESRQDDEGIPDTKKLVNFVVPTNLTSLTFGSELMKWKLSTPLFGVINISTHLQYLCIFGIKLNDNMLNLSGFSYLSDLRLGYISISEECARSLCRSIKSCIRLETLLLMDIKLYDGVLELKNLNNLKHFILSNVTMSEDCIRYLFGSVSALTCLRILELVSITKCDGALELKSVAKFSSPNHLTTLKVSDITMSCEHSKSFCDSIRFLTHMQTLKIENISLFNGRLDLKNMTGLTSLIMKKVSMSSECSRSMCSSINERTKLSEISLSDISLYDGLLDLRRLTQLTSLTLNNVELTKECSRSLCASISVCACLESLKLEHVNLYDGVLDLRRLENLKTFSIVNVLCSYKSRCILKESLKHCPMLMENNIEIYFDDADSYMDCNFVRCMNICCCM